MSQQQVSDRNRMKRISLEHVYKAYQKNHYVVKDLSLEIFEGEFLVLVGPSGCGKTTTLRMIAGLEELTHGDLSVDGVKFNDKDPALRDLSFVFQNYALLPHMTVETNIAFGLLHYRLSRIEVKKRVEEVAKKLSLYDKLGHYPAQLSGGQRQRVALARALVDEEKMILFDEPLSNLDALLRESMRKELISLYKNMHVTCLYVTHDQLEAMALATRMVMMKDGLVMQVGTPKQMYDEPHHLEVAKFIGSLETNVFYGDVKDHAFYVNHEMILLNEAMHQLLNTTYDQPMYLSIRPNQITLSKKHKEGFIEGIIEYIEYLGEHYLLHSNALNQKVSVLTEEDVKDLDKVYIKLGGICHLFDKNQIRVYKDLVDTVIISKEPSHEKDLQVIKEIKNYGYKVVYDHHNPDIIYEDSNRSCVFKNRFKHIKKEHLKDLIPELLDIRFKRH